MPCMVLGGVIALGQLSSLLASKRGRVPQCVLQTWGAVWQAVFLDHEFVVILQISELRKAMSILALGLLLFLFAFFVLIPAWQVLETHLMSMCRNRPENEMCTHGGVFPTGPGLEQSAGETAAGQSGAWLTVRVPGAHSCHLILGGSLSCGPAAASRRRGHVSRRKGS